MMCLHSSSLFCYYTASKAEFRLVSSKSRPVTNWRLCKFGDVLAKKESVQFPSTSFRFPALERSKCLRSFTINPTNLKLQFWISLTFERLADTLARRRL